ncbi:MAG: sigma-70 family RNA polymerase sigma factor [Lapillicoccus sp.]
MAVHSGPGRLAGTFARPGSEAGDATLVRAARLGDREAFEVVVERYGPALYRFARRMVRDHDEAQDVVQEALVAAWRGLERFDGRSSLATWLFGITSHKARDSLRRRRPEPVDPDLLTRPGRDTIDRSALSNPEEAMFLSDLAEALGQLSERQRAVWLLTQVEGLSTPEAAQALRMSADAVRGQLARARMSLTTRLEAWR